MTEIKRSVWTVALLMMSIAASAQHKVRSLSLEAFGAQNTIGLNFDSRLQGQAGWGYRVGVGFGYGNNSGFFDENIKGVGLPLEINYLLGARHHKLEMGLGSNLGVYHVKTTRGYFTPSTGESEYFTTSDNRFGYLMFANIGYRYQRPNGLLLRAGITPSFNFGGEHALHKSPVCPYLGIGWAF